MSKNTSIEFITTSCNRPEILDRTYNSFTTNLKNINFTESTLYINVDPAPNNDHIEEMKKVANKYFGTVVINNPKKPNFAKAVKWCTSQPKGKYVFYLEDDWNLSTEVDIYSLIDIMEKDTNIKKVQLRNKCISNNAPGNKHRFGLPPGLWQSEILINFSKQMIDNLNPESQIVNYQRKLMKDGFDVKKVIFGDSIIIHDIGRWWLKQKKLKRNYGNNENKWTPWIGWCPI